MGERARGEINMEEGWSIAQRSRLDEKKKNLFKDPDKRRKPMKEEVRKKLERRASVLQERPFTASKKREIVENAFRDWVTRINTDNRRVINYDSAGLDANNYTINAVSRDSGFVAPYYVNINGHLRGGRTIAMPRKGNVALLPLAGPDGRILLGATAKYWSASLYPHIRLIKFVAAVPHRKDDKVGGVKSNNGPKEQFYKAADLM